MKTAICSILVVSAALLQGCSYPEPAKVEQQDRRPVIGISGAPEGAVFYVDGLEMGPIEKYDGKNGVLMVESGKHLIELKAANGDVLYSEELFLGNNVVKVIKYAP